MALKLGHLMHIQKTQVEKHANKQQINVGQMHAQTSKWCVGRSANLHVPKLQGLLKSG